MLFNTTKSLMFAPGASRQIGELLRNKGLSRPLIVTDSGIVKAGLLQACLEGLPAAVVFDGVVPDPTEQNVLDAVAMCVANDCDSIVGFGGGSPMDVAKVTSFLANPSNRTVRLADCYGVEMLRGDRLHLVQVPTTAGTGSEVTPISILTTGGQSKMGVVSSVLLPDVAVLDGGLTLSVPKSTTAHTGIDAM
jgi:alcohol dehydrogenase